MAIKGMEGLSDSEVTELLRRGAKFVVFSYTISILIMTFKRPSAVHFVRPDENAFVKGLPYSLLTWVLGWWGIPWGPIYSVQSLVGNIGGRDVTAQVVGQASATD